MRAYMHNSTTHACPDEQRYAWARPVCMCVVCGFRVVRCTTNRYLLWRLQISHPKGITYGDLAGEVIGPCGKNLVFVFIYTAFFGNMAILLLTCSDALAEMMCVQVCMILCECADRLSAGVRACAALVSVK